jgi:hypothetical protein
MGMGVGGNLSGLNMSTSGKLSSANEEKRLLQLAVKPFRNSQRNFLSWILVVITLRNLSISSLP